MEVIRIYSLPFRREGRGPNYVSHTLSESYHQIIFTYLELISNSIHIFTELLPSSSNTFLRVSMDIETGRKFLKNVGGRGEYIPWKIRIQIQTTRNSLAQGTKSEKS